MSTGEFPYHGWHKDVKEHIVKKVGLKIEYGKEVFKGVDRGTFKTLGDREHAEIIRLLVEENYGMVQIAEKLGRSSKTINDHIKFHNKGVDKATFCSRCKRIDGKYTNVIAERQCLDKYQFFKEIRACRGSGNKTKGERKMIFFERGYHFLNPEPHSSKIHLILTNK